MNYLFANIYQTSCTLHRAEAYLTELLDSTAKDVNIVRDAELQAQKAGLGIGGDNSVPTTGDNSRAEGLLIAMIAAGVVIVYCVRRKVSA